MPFGAIASSMVRTMESLPGSHPAEMIDTAPCSLATSTQSHGGDPTIPVWISKLSTVLIPIARISFAYFSTLRVGVQRIATSTSLKFLYIFNYCVIIQFSRFVLGTYTTQPHLLSQNREPLGGLPAHNAPILP